MAPKPDIDEKVGSAKGKPEVTPEAQETAANDEIETDARLKAFQELIDFANSLPALGWPDGTSPDDDKRVLRKRYL